MPGPESAGLLTVTGRRYGMTRIVNVHVLVLPEGSTAVHVTVLVPTGNTDPDGGVE